MNPSTFASSRHGEVRAEVPEQARPHVPPSKRRRPRPKPEYRLSSWWPPDLLYPIRGTAEALGVIATLSVVYWIFTILIPEYCQSLQRDAESMGATSMGYLVSLITALPAVLLTPFAVFYTLQYLARVLIARALGDPVPPRSPDRNFDGFLSGLGPWLIWLFLSGAIALVPWAAQRFGSGQKLEFSTQTAILALVGFPYLLMALMLSFLHDNPFAAKPTTVLASIVKLGPSYGVLCITVAVILGLSLVPFVMVRSLHDTRFWIYIPACLACWATLLWGAIVAMAVAGGYYHKHHEKLRWHQERPRWGVAWKL